MLLYIKCKQPFAWLQYLGISKSRSGSLEGSEYDNDVNNGDDDCCDCPSYLII